MRTRFSRMLDEPPPADALAYKGLRYVLRPADAGGRCGITIWYGKSKRPKRWAFRSEQHRAEWLAGEIRSQDASEQHKARRLAERDQSRAAMADKIQVGTILHYSWGYDQTNCEFFQVVEKRGQYIWMRPIGCRTVEGSEGFMCRSVRPARDQFTDDKPPIKKLISAYGVSMEFGSASPCGDDSKHYESSYA